MADAFLFDTSAFITLTDREPGVDRVRELLSAARRGEVALYGCFVSLTEVQYIKTYEDGAEKARRIMNAIQRFPISWIHSDAALCASAAELKAAHTISFADAFVAAAAGASRGRPAAQRPSVQGADRHPQTRNAAAKESNRGVELMGQVPEVHL